MKRLLLVLVLGLFISVQGVLAEENGTTTNEQNVTSVKEKAAAIKEKIILTKTQIKAKQQTIKDNHQTLAALREQVKTKITETKALIKQYRETKTLTKEQIDNIKARIVAIKDSRQAIVTAYGKVGEQLQQYKAKTVDERLNGLDAIILAQEQRITMYQEAIAKFNK
jgi:chromosome segregation ATPase